MRKQKVLGLIIVIILMINAVFPAISMAVEEINNVMEKGNELQEEKENQTIVKEEESNQLEEEPVNDEMVEEGEESVSDEMLEEVEEPVSDEKLEETREENQENHDNSNIALESTVTSEENHIEEKVEEKIMTLSESPFSAYVEVTSEYKIDTFEKDGIYYLFLPNTTDLSNVLIHYNEGSQIVEAEGNSIDEENRTINVDFTTRDTLKVTMQNHKKATIKVMKSDIPSMYINLKEVDLATLNGGSKETKYKASMQIVGAEKEEYNLSDANIEIKGRGNSTWTLRKKPYQIKLDKKQNLLGMGTGKSKKWILLANQLDRTLMRNKLIDDLQKEIGLSDTMNARFIDLYVNGEYQGNYLLCEKVEIGSARINLTDSKGVVCEMDNAYGTQEDYYFKTKRSNMIFTLKDSVSDVDEPEELSEALAGFENFRKAINDFEDAIYASNPNWEEISKKIDVESFIKYYFMTELAEDPDRFITSTFVYQDGPNDVLHMAAIWDNDTAIGYHEPLYAGGSTTTDYTLNVKKYRQDAVDWYTQLYRNKEFSVALNKTYNETIKPVFATTIHKINSYTDSMWQSVAMNFTRWNIEKTQSLPTAHPLANTHEGEVTYLKNWLTARIRYLNDRYSSENTVIYQSQVRNIGRDDYWRRDGQTSGTEGYALPIETIQITLPNASSNQHIKYSAHVENYGWMNEKQDGNEAGVVDLKIEAIKIWLEGMEGYNIKYRVHVSEIGWMNWVKNGEEAGTTGRNLPIEAIEIMLEKIEYLGNEEINEDAMIHYKAHMQDIGWSGWGHDGERIGTVGQSKKLEAITIDLGKSVEDKELLTYRAHVQDDGWQDWKEQGQEAGTTGQNKRMEAIEIKVNNPEKYRLSYRVHVENYGWMDWKTSGELAGTTGQALRIEAIEIKLEQKRFLGTKEENTDSLINYQAHIQDIGWSGYGTNKEVIGTMTECKQLEAICIKVAPELQDKLTYNTHIAEYGWQEGNKAGEICGSTGQGIQLEAFYIQLEDCPNYEISYRAYVENIGWMNWVSNGQIAGTTGQSLRIEAIQIKIEEK